MNAAIRAVTRAAIYRGIRVKAIYKGYQGIIEGLFKEFRTEDVSNIILQVVIYSCRHANNREVVLLSQQTGSGKRSVAANYRKCINALST